ncbi:MAG: DUF2156 domain-containing protein [Nanoarchaeota archaeon]|nr:DUF2156 domain-containing protein [Nanoarchaeota archaeon]
MTLEDRELFDRYFKRFPPEISELTFTNLFTWQKTRPIVFEERQEHLIIKADIDEPYFFAPVGPSTESLLKELAQEAPLSRVPEELAKRAKGLNVIEERQNWDYVYNQIDLADLPGTKYMEKRNFIKSAFKHSPEFAECTPEIVKECLALQEAWCNLRDCSSGTLLGEDQAIRETFKHVSELPIMGMAIKINGKVEAFTLGEPLNESTFVIHFEKANGSYRGLYQFINKAMAEKLSSYRWINREQDLGLEGLRKAKLSYHPDHFVKKFCVKL